MVTPITYAWALVLALVTVAIGWAAVGHQEPLWFELDEAITSWIGSHRTAWLVDAADGLEWLGSPWSLRVGLWVGLAVLVIYRRWRQLWTLAATVVGVEWITQRLSDFVARPRPEVALESIDGFAHPSMAMAGIAVTLVGLAYSLVPRGPWRRLAFVSSGVVLMAAGLARLYLAVGHLSDLALGALGGVATAIGAFTLFVPDESFPIGYERRSSAHLPVSGQRGIRLRSALDEQLLNMEGAQASMMRQALYDQLGCDVVDCQLVDLAPFGLAGSAGSTPLKISVSGRHEGELFAKLYSTSHLRSDRWYKLGRAILYGRLEDERSFSSVRRLVEYEDYMLRVMRDAGLPSAEPLGIIQLVPGREYLIVTEFFEGAEEIGDADVDESVIKQGMVVIRRLWDAGLAHRDIKPANLLVRRGELKVIDVAFGEVRASRWRQLVDLANMMLVLGLRAGPEAVFRQAQEFFGVKEIAGAFAVSGGVTVPSQLRSMLKEHRATTGVDLLAEFVAMGPPTDPVPIQRWGIRRIALTASVLVGATAMLVVVFQNLRGVGLL